MWLAVVARSGACTRAFPGLLSKFARVSSREADQWQKTRALREEREEVRRVDSELRARRTPVKIEPPAPPQVEKSDRAKREQKIPLFHVGDGSGIPPLALLDEPRPQAKGYDEQTLEIGRASCRERGCQNG